MRGWCFAAFAKCRAYFEFTVFPATNLLSPHPHRPSPTMKLEKLIEYTSDQEHKINRLIGRAGCFVGFSGNTNYTHSWVKFRDFLWGNVRALEPLEGEVEGDGTIVESSRVHPRRFVFGKFAYPGMLRIKCYL